MLPWFRGLLNSSILIFQYQSAKVPGGIAGGHHVAVDDLPAGFGPGADGRDGQVLRLPDAAGGVRQDLAVRGTPDALPGLLGDHPGGHPVRRDVLLHVRYS